MDDDRIDFSSLDPSRDPRHFAQLVADVVHRARARRSLTAQLARLARPVLFASAACAALAWTAALLDPRPGVQTAGVSAELLSHWSNDSASGGALQELIGGDDVGP